MPQSAILDLSAPVAELTATLVDIPSESRGEDQIADAVESALLQCPHLVITRHGNTVVARTTLGRDERVLIGGHLDTVPAADNLPHRIADGRLYGLGACDMKGGVAVALSLAASEAMPVRDVTYVFYECEEIDARFNGLQRLTEDDPSLLQCDLAVLMEPSGAGVEAGCQGTLRVRVLTTGQRAHSARSWLGENAIHRAGDVLARLNAYEPRRATIDGLEYREGLNAVAINGGVAGNVIPDECSVTVNYRFAPDLSTEHALAHLHEVFVGYEIEVDDAAPGALPGLGVPAAADFVAAVGDQPRPKFGWTDVARFAGMGIPALNYGPGDPALAHTREEHVALDQLERCLATMRDWLRGRSHGASR